MKKTLVNPGFELTNLQRRYLGLGEASPHWEKVPVNKSNIILYFDGDIIRKMVTCSENVYYESDLLEHTAENRTILLPKTKRGKPRKLNFTATQYFSAKGVYFSFSEKHIVIANYTTQTTFYEEENSQKLTILEWLDRWVADTSEEEYQEIQEFKTAKRKHQKYAEGDFFTFRIGHRKWGFGRIVLDVAKRRKTEGFKEANPGLEHLMGQALFIMVYRYISDSPHTDIDKLRKYGTLPVQQIMDNRIYYGEYRIIGNHPVEPEEWEPVISLNRSYSFPEEDSEDNIVFWQRRKKPHISTYLQYGLICVKTDNANLEKFLVNGKYSGSPIHSNQAIGFNINHYDKIEIIINEGIDSDSLLLSNENFKDLRKKENYEAKAAIFKTLGLDPDKSYAENLRIFETRKNH
ncbi:MAG: immunity 26/phosphotriesterase HocA family protein [Muribaculaceae bacterium]|nr:immunity 26/phosphotriesterase HocA family protein [Muribaculaceae bacterium]